MYLIDGRLGGILPWEWSFAPSELPEQPFGKEVVAIVQGSLHKRAEGCRLVGVEKLALCRRGGDYPSFALGGNALCLEHLL